MKLLTDFSVRLGLKGPLIVAPLGGGPTTPALVAASANAGALGTLAGAYLSPKEIEEAINQTRALTNKPFAINLFVPLPNPSLDKTRIDAAIEACRAYRRELGIPDPLTVAPPFHHDFQSQLEIVLKAKPIAFSFVFGQLDTAILRELKRNGILSIGTATCLAEAKALAESGVDAVIAQGVEAGGHRGTFRAEDEDPAIGTLALTRALSKEIELPIIASGGIMSSSQIRDAIGAGAQAVQMGTYFLLADEAGTSPAYRKSLQETEGRFVTITRTFSGRLAQGLSNRFINEMEPKKDAILPFPAQNAFTRDIRAKAAQLQNPEYLSLWAGTGVGQIKAGKTEALIAQLFSEL